MLTTNLEHDSGGINGNKRRKLMTLLRIAVDVEEGDQSKKQFYTIISSMLSGYSFSSATKMIKTLMQQSLPQNQDNHMTLNPDEREKQLSKILNDIGEKVNQQMKEANARLKGYYESGYTSAIRDAKAANSRGDTLTALFFQMKANNLSDALRAFG